MGQGGFQKMGGKQTLEELNEWGCPCWGCCQPAGFGGAGNADYRVLPEQQECFHPAGLHIWTAQNRKESEDANSQLIKTDQKKTTKKFHCYELDTWTLDRSLSCLAYDGVEQRRQKNLKKRISFFKNLFFWKSTKHTPNIFVLLWTFLDLHKDPPLMGGNNMVFLYAKKTHSWQQQKKTRAKNIAFKHSHPCHQTFLGKTS